MSQSAREQRLTLWHAMQPVEPANRMLASSLQGRAQTSPEREGAERQGYEKQGHGPGRRRRDQRMQEGRVPIGAGAVTRAEAKT
jgi:hypothetical protein